MKDARNKARLTDNLRTKTNKALGATEQKNKELNMKLAAEDRGRKSAEASLKNARAQAEEQRRKLHYTEIKLAMAKQQVVDLKAKLEKA